jgi:hypothetical protein
MSDKKSKFKIEPNINISKGSFSPNPKVKVETENRYYGVKGEYNIIDTDTTNLKITGNVGKGSGRADVTHPFGKDTFKGEGSLDKEIRFKLTKKFSKGGTVKDYIKDLL